MYCNLYKLIYSVYIIFDQLQVKYMPVLRQNKHNDIITRPKGEYTTSYVAVFFVFNELMWEVIVCFIDIGGIAYTHCLNFLLFCWYW